MRCRRRTDRRRKRQQRTTATDLCNDRLPRTERRHILCIVDTSLGFSLRGNAVSAQWTLSTNAARWASDSSGVSRGTLETLIGRVLSGLSQLDVTAELSGTLRAPRFAVHSNLDEAIADRVRGILGEELRAAETRVRAQVDSLVGGEIEKARARADTATADLRGRVATVKQELATAKAQLEARLRALSGGLGGVLGM